MLWIKINAYQIALVIQNGDLKAVLKKGLYLKPFGATIYRFDMTKAFHAPLNWAILEKNDQLMEMLEIIDVADNELVVEYRDERFINILTTGRYAYWKGVLKQNFERYNIDELEIPKALSRKLIQAPAFANYVRSFEILPNEKAVLYVDDAYSGILESGIYYYWKNAQSVKLERTDMRQQLVEIGGQELLTADKAALRINFDLTYRVTNVETALVKNKSYEKQLYTLMQLVLREYVGELTLDELLENKEKVSESVLKSVGQKAYDLGVVVLSAGIRDVILPGEVKEIMNQVLVAQKKAQANIITRREETASTRSLLNTAKLMEENEMLFRLKEMEYVEKIAEKIGEISLSGNGGMVNQLKEIFSAKP
ncbi:slipin family protein [Moheibacter sediminis]|uniref:SPFH domain / Band 7 family protein n=1 Tax=Moheibacter sediminis TaxID=1434700 RepID=A0A1W2C7T9_9FLAO|nr:slipin family protein [Moheibacter sediminis]SMC81166.1 SPFH domain / Band 7 family protein [Moheibacter sediminis]